MISDDNKDFAGKNGFVWFIGCVEDRQDPIKLGRVRVRCVGWHAADKMRLPTEELPWAMVTYPPNNTNPYAPKEGDMVFGFFADNMSAQVPIIIATFPSIPLKAANIQEGFSDPRTSDELKASPRSPEKKTYNTDGTGIVITEKPLADNYPLNLDEPTTSRIARNDSDTIIETFIQERKNNVVTDVETYNSTWDEPETQYNAVYPYNNVMETESGHIVEYDDTPGAERIHIAHRNGSFTEWYPDGDRVEKITKDKYSIVMKDDNVYIMGQCNITVQGDAEIYVKENAWLKVDKNVEAIVEGDVTADVGGDVTATVEGDVTATVEGDVTATVEGDVTADVGGDVTADVGGDVTADVGGSFSMDIGGTCDITSGGNMSFTAPRIDLN